jgi:hypothetical protein
MRVAVPGEVYTIDSVAEHPPTRNAELHLSEPARADYEGPGYSIEPGWEVRVARHRPDVVCLMFVNDGAMPADRLANWREMVRRIREQGAVPVLLSPFPVDDATHGGNHPGFHEKVLQNAAAVRALAEAEAAWFVDVAGLTLALDPPLRSLVCDGIHPDTDGQTAAIDGLLWVFGQMGLTRARPFIKGWVLAGPPASLEELLAAGVRPFRISQPDHPDPDHQDEKGFTLEAIRRNDEYGLLAVADGNGLALEAGVLLEFGWQASAESLRLALLLYGSDLAAPQVWDDGAGAWLSLGARPQPGGVRAEVPAAATVDGVAFVLVTGGVHAVLDAVALEIRGGAAVAAWRPSDARPAAYCLSSDHARPENLVRNADFAAGAEGVADSWRLTGEALANRPFRVPLAGVALGDSDDLCLASIARDVRVRPYDLLMVDGSQVGNDGAYRVKDVLGEGRCRVRRRPKATESGLHGELRHDDGCGLVPGGCCLELRAGGRAETALSLPPGATALDLSLFRRIYDPARLGTRDLPGRQSLVQVAFRGPAGGELGEPWQAAGGPDSYQWRKGTFSVPVPAGAASAVLVLGTTGPATAQYTGVFAAARVESPRGP